MHNLITRHMIGRSLGPATASNLDPAPRDTRAVDPTDSAKFRAQTRPWLRRGDRDPAGSANKP